MSDVPARVEETFERHPAFEPAGEREHAARNTPLDATARILAAGGGEGSEVAAVRVTVRVPMLDAAVTDEEVAPVVEDGWFETLERRLADAHTVTLADDAAPPTVEREDDTARVELVFRTANPENAPEDAQAVIEFVQGTWMQGVIPGYEYGGPAKELLERAEQEYDGTESGANPS